MDTCEWSLKDQLKTREKFYVEVKNWNLDVSAKKLRQVTTKDLIFMHDNFGEFLVNDWSNTSS